MTRQFESALEHVREGYPVFPAHGITESGRCTCGNPNCQNPGKHPAVNDWQKAATTDPERIRYWWNKNSEYNPAIPAGNDLFVLDADGEEGRESLRKLEEKYGPLPVTRTVISGREDGGEHRYFHKDPGMKIRNSVSKLGEHLDVRGDGGYVIAPGARHASGRFYEWKEGCSPADCRQSRLPDWMISLLNGKKEPVADPDEILLNDIIPEGKRNDTLFKYGCFLRGQGGKTMFEVDQILRRENEARCRPPLTDDEMTRLICSIDRFPRGGETEDDFDDSQLKGLICAANVVPEKTNYLIKPYIPDRKITIIQGDPGSGKTYFSLAIAASVSKGEPFMGIPCEQGDVLIISVEEENGELAERIASVNADRNHCFFIKEEEAGDMYFTSWKVEGYIRKYRPKLVIFDPFQAFLGSRVDMHRANETRPIMTKLANLGKKYDCAIILICHMPKSSAETSSVLRALGSIDIPAASRSILQIGRVDDNPSMGLMVQVKCSNAQKGRSALFTIEDGKGVVLRGFTDKDESNFYTGGKKIKKAVDNPFIYEQVRNACKRILAEYPNGRQVPYSELGLCLPSGLKTKTLLISMRGRLEAEGIEIGRFQRGKDEMCVTITPHKEEEILSEPNPEQITFPTLPA